MYEMGVGMNGKSVHVDELYTTILKIMTKYYGRLYDMPYVESLSESLAAQIETGVALTRGDIRFFIHCNTSGGGVADMSSTDIQAALPSRLQDTDYRSYKGRVDR